MPRKCPQGAICFDSFTFIFIFILTSVLIYYLITTQGLQQHIGGIQSQSQTQSPFIPFSVSEYIVKQEQNSLQPVARPGISYNKDPKDVLLNPYAPPVQVNQPHAYKQVGYLKNEMHSDKMFPIFAKPQHLRRDKWYYYTIYDNIKLPIYFKNRKCSSEHGCDSLMNGDIVKLENMDGSFTVSMYDNATLVYDPVI